MGESPEWVIAIPLWTPGLFAAHMGEPLSRRFELKVQVTPGASNPSDSIPVGPEISG
jgi:hypothetical protein